jgi:hypothetical protein
MSLLHEIQEAALDSKVDISDLLRKCLVLAIRLENKDFQKWVDQELDGYADGADLPEYRVLKANSYGHFTNGYCQLQNYIIPSRTIPEEIREVATTVYLGNAISALDYMVKHAKEGSLQFAWPGDIIAFISNKVYVDYSCIAAYNHISVSSIAAIIDTVRTRVLEFVLEIKKEAPNAGDALTGPQPIAPERVRQIFYTIVMGNVGNLASGGSGISQSSYQEIRQGDLESLKEYLLGLGIGIQPVDIQELENALVDDEERCLQETIGDRTKKWIEKIAGNASEGIGGVGIGVAADLIAKGIAMYLGLPS